MIYLKEINLNKDLNIRNILIANLLREFYIYFMFEEYIF